MQSPLNKYNEKFKAALAGLNPEQLAAVNKMDGPVLVVAGPGTGKTQILAARIGKILTDTDAQPNEILCLTYTDAGAVAMRKRLFEFIGPDAYRINIYTFHAFCNEIIQENLEYFGKLNLEALSDLESAMLFRELVDEFGNDHLLKRFTGDIYFDAPRLKKLFSTMKTENWSEELVVKAVQDYLADLPNRDEFIYKRANPKAGIKIGDPKQKDIDKVTETMQKLLAAVSEYKNYDAKMKSRGRYDYDDMIMWVLKAFRENDEILRRYQERYQYILVDEFQDTSGSQNELLRFLLNYWDTPNVFVVGDDDQSIFKFQGANMKNILDFAGDYVNTLYTVVLKHNYRSNQHILDISRALINNNRERLTAQLNLDKNLQSSHPRFSSDVVVPSIKEYENPNQELVDVAMQIKRLVAQGTPPGEIAVIYRNHSQVDDLLHFLETQNIAVNTKRKIDVLTMPFGEKIINILRYLAMELDSPYSGDELLFEILHYDFFDIPPIEIAKASIAVSKENFATTSNNQPKTSLRRYIHEIKVPAQTDLFSKPVGTNMKFLINDIDELLTGAVSVTLQQLFQSVISKMGILKYIMQQQDKGTYMQVLTSFFDFLKDESRKNPEIKLSDLINTIDLMRKNGIRMELNKVIFSENGINFLTAHGSKGLEFEHVFFIGCDKKTWDAKGRNSGFSYPDTLTQAASEDIALKEESRRLFYVALTRAKQCLNVSYAAKDKNGKDQEPSQFIGEILADTHLQVSYPKVSSDDMIEFIATQFNEADKPVVELLDRNYINQLLQNYTLSVTHLNNYLDCPLRFYFQCLIRVPSGKSPSATFGQAVHWALNKAFRRLKDFGDEFMPTEEFMKEFRWYMYRNRDSFTKEDFKLRVAYGEKILPPYYEQNVLTWNKVTRTEHSIKNIEVQGVPIKGNLDKIEFNGKQVTVVDYKTGRVRNAKPKLERPTNEQPNGGDYWRQAVFYKILVDNDRTNDWEVVDTIFDFVEPEKDNEYYKAKVVITPEDIEEVTSQITSTYQKIMNHEFSTGCGKKECDWCHFVKSNFKQPEGLLEIAEGDDVIE
ncbi:ATP-dependent DNA helicase [Mucilaginibacter sp.]|uniref:ATP-dependent DNA helicase n=1 Tax=Mucilaginibacter sp. TaxID=1882438 RepID=UPI000CB475F8|nr:ATP-dependent DNA helicase [Mucilaginibacter sp.]PLW89043.1 MAG: DNA helicase UvrD [Mucilaginibacter sp.]PMP64458.1 MAG: DNA helicase UvrD [Mucilaginibacter sp.]HEK18959.1 ATP-dependent helicase [Bacteroidota bacterium]